MGLDSPEFKLPGNLNNIAVNIRPHNGLDAIFQNRKPLFFV